jgi:16S rRNA (cytidine1402-2'-O)-methyltransferase
MENKIYIVSTPIGNLKDITLRALETLKLVEVIACEDTRVTRKILSHYEIKGKKLISYHDRNEKNSAQGIIDLYNKGLNIAIVSDAGTPVIADPGFEIIRRTKNKDINIEFIPGVSALAMVISMSSLSPFAQFLGFLPPKTGKRQNVLKALKPGSYVTFVSPYKLEKTLEDIREVFSPTARVFLAKELTKKNERHYSGTILEVYDQVKNNVKGEYTLVFEVLNVK